MHADEIWHRPPTSDPAISELMTEGCKLLLAPSRAPKVIPQGDGQLLEAEKIFSQIIYLDPAFAEVGILSKIIWSPLAQALWQSLLVLMALAKGNHFLKHRLLYTSNQVYYSSQHVS